MTSLSGAIREEARGRRAAVLVIFLIGVLAGWALPHSCFCLDDDDLVTDLYWYCGE